MSHRSACSNTLTITGSTNRVERRIACCMLHQAGCSRLRVRDASNSTSLHAQREFKWSMLDSSFQCWPVEHKPFTPCSLYRQTNDETYRT